MTVQLPVLPGEQRIAAGIRDLRAGVESVDALLVAIGATRLRLAGVDVPEPVPGEPERRLYRLLARTHGDDAHGRYNALIRLLVSHERALEFTIARKRRLDAGMPR